MLAMTRLGVVLSFLLISVLIISPESAQALTLSPVKAELAGDPGQTITAEVELYNEQTEARTFYITYENFEPSGEDGSPKFVGGGTGLATWITAEKSVVIGGGEKMTVPYAITIPKDAEPGGFFGAIFFGGQNPEATAGGEVSVGGKLGTLILLRVRGDVPESAGLSLFSTINSQRLFSELPVTFEYKVANNGGDRIMPTGDITITNTFGATAGTLVVNEKGGNILPNSARKFQASWGVPYESKSFFDSVQHQWDDLHFGWYTAHARVVWGEKDTQALARYDFFMIPWQLSVVGVLLLGMGIFILRKYNSWIVSRAKKNS